MTEDRGLRPGLFPDHLVEVGGPGAEHLPEVGAAEPALVAAAGLPHDVLERPAALAGERGQRGEGHALADAAGDADGGHSGNIGRKEEADLGLGGAKGRKRKGLLSACIALLCHRHSKPGDDSGNGKGEVE